MDENCQSWWYRCFLYTSKGFVVGTQSKCEYKANTYIISTRITIHFHPYSCITKDSLAEGLKAIAFMKRLVGDLQYTGLLLDVDTLDHFIYGDLEKRVGRKTTHVRKSSFTELQVRNTNATKKYVKKVAQKAPVKRIVSQKVIRHCLACGKAGHTKVNCPGIK